ncbi:uncharacterized protein [Diabrotica undecimpunctata]|uniref:uncharacterized protein n=1 Tax=Diabrotica undecimpunctata TaxID=50387 RepID=UPI003B635EDC
MCVYAPQIGLGKNERKDFYDQLDDILSDIPSKEKVVIESDFNAHVGQSRTEYESIHGGLGFLTRNEAEATCYLQKMKQLVIYKSEQNQSQIDYFMTRKENIHECKDFTVIVSETVS